MSLLHTQGLNVAIGDKLLCNDLDLTIRSGEVWGILGKNGAGKTTLLQTLAGLRPTQSGHITLMDQALCDMHRRDIAQKMGVLLQDHHDAFPASVLETALIGRHPHLGQWQWESAEDMALARSALKAVELDAYHHRSTDTLSGGERQRLAIATLLTQDPLLMLLDEPSNHLDLHHQISLLEQLKSRVQKNKGAIIMVLHDLNLAARFCNHLLLLFDDGQHQSGLSEAMLNTDHLNRLYDHPIKIIEDEQSRAFLPR